MRTDLFKDIKTGQVDYSVIEKEDNKRKFLSKVARKYEMEVTQELNESFYKFAIFTPLKEPLPFNVSGVLKNFYNIKLEKLMDNYVEKLKEAEALYERNKFVKVWAESWDSLLTKSHVRGLPYGSSMKKKGIGNSIKIGFYNEEMFMALGNEGNSQDDLSSFLVESLCAISQNFLNNKKKRKENDEASK